MAKRIEFAMGTQHWYFRQPNLGNTDTLSFQRINRRSRGGDLILFRDNQWPSTETLGLTFDFNSDLELREFLEFLKIVIGEFIYYRDHEGIVWGGVIQSPASQGTQASHNSFQISIVFEGDHA